MAPLDGMTPRHQLHEPEDRSRELFLPEARACDAARAILANLDQLKHYVSLVYARHHDDALDDACDVLLTGIHDDHMVAFQQVIETIHARVDAGEDR